MSSLKPRDELVQPRRLKCGTQRGLDLVRRIMSRKPERNLSEQDKREVGRRATLSTWARRIRAAQPKSRGYSVISLMLRQSPNVYSLQLRGRVWPKDSAQAIALDLWGVAEIGPDPMGGLWNIKKGGQRA